MPACLIVTRHGPVRDEAAMAEYGRLTRLMAGAVVVEPLAIHGAIHPLEGDAPDAINVLRFATLADAHAFYDHPAYRAALPYRLKIGDWRAIIVEGRGGAA